MKLTWTMRAVRPIALSLAVAISTSLIAAAPARNALTAETLSDPIDTFVVAQTSTGFPDPVPAPSRPAPARIPAPPKMDYVPPSSVPGPLPGQPNAASTDAPWRAIGFTAGGSHSSNWRIARQAETEARATKGCAQFGRGACRVVSFSGQECIALATLIGSCGRRRWNLSFTAGRATDPQAQSAAIGRCYADERSQGRSQPRAVASADGR